jgi:hypothetical protein
LAIKPKPLLFVAAAAQIKFGALQMSDDRELKAMATLLEVMEPLEADERQRVFSWLVQKLAVEGGPIRTPVRQQTGISVNANGQRFEHSTDTIATLIGTKSGSDLIVAAAAHLHFAQGKQKFTRQELTTEMRSAPAHFKETYVNNLSTYLTGLTKSDRLRLVGAHTYALSNTERQGLEMKLANA